MIRGANGRQRAAAMLWSVAASACAGDSRAGSDLRIEGIALAAAATDTGPAFEIPRARDASTDTTSGEPELPRLTIDSRVAATPSLGRRLHARTAGALTAALRDARPGDVILLVPGTSYVGNFRLPRPRAAGAGWITLRTEGDLPAEGTRISPSTGATLPRILTPNASPALATEPGAHHLRVMGLEVSAVPSVHTVYALVALGEADATQSTPASVPHHIVLDRVYVHGSPTLDLRRCVALNSAWTAVVDSHLGECHSNNGDSQAIWGGNGPGPFSIVGNRLEGAGENVMFGGSDPAIRGLVPSDIEIRRNHFVKPLAWRGKWAAKNLLELKNGQRVLVEGNVFENSWVSAQIGFAVVLWSVNQDGRAPWTTTRDVTFRLNTISNVAHGFQLNDRAEQPSVAMARVTIAHNLVRDVGAPALGDGGGRLFQVNGRVADLRIEHNTTGSAGPWLLFVAQPIAPLPRMRVLNNVAFATSIALRSDFDNGERAWATYAGAAGGTMRGNVLAGAVGGLPAGNSSPVGPAADATASIGFRNPRAGDYALASSSSFRRRATDGTDPGVDAAALARATAGVTQP